MRIARIGTGLALVLSCTCLYAKTPAQEMTVTGKLARVMAIGGESTGWTIQLDSEAAIDGNQVNSIEVDSRKAKRLKNWRTSMSRLQVCSRIGREWRLASG